MSFRRGLAGTLQTLACRHDPRACLLRHLTILRSSHVVCRQACVPHSCEGKPVVSGSAPKETHGGFSMGHASKTRGFKSGPEGENQVSFSFSDSHEEMELPGAPAQSEARTDEKEYPRPAEIPWQEKVANSVNLIGRVGAPVHLETFPDGSAYAITILEQKNTPNFPQLWIPVIFQGELAGIAGCHLKEDDRIHVSGQLSADSPQIVIEDRLSTVHVMAQSLSFIRGHLEGGRTEALHKRLPHATYLADKQKGSILVNNLWDDLLSNPGNWVDLRNSKTKTNQPDFKHNISGDALWIGKTTPLPVTLALESPAFCEKLTKGKSGTEDSWKDLIDNPGRWWDNRLKKTNPRAPDFKHKETGEGLWLDSSPYWARSKFTSAVEGNSLY